MHISKPYLVTGYIVYWPSKENAWLHSLFYVHIEYTGIVNKYLRELFLSYVLIYTKAKLWLNALNNELIYGILIINGKWLITKPIYVHIKCTGIVNKYLRELLLSYLFIYFKAKLWLNALINELIYVILIINGKCLIT